MPYSGLDFLVSYKKSTFVKCHSGDIDPLLPSHPETLLTLLVVQTREQMKSALRRWLLPQYTVENPGRDRVAAHKLISLTIRLLFAWS